MSNQSTIQDELFTTKDLEDQVFAAEGIRIQIGLIQHRYLTRSYKDVYPLKTQGDARHRAELLRDRLLHMVKHYHTHAKKYSDPVITKMSIQIPKEDPVTA